MAASVLQGRTPAGSGAGNPRPVGRGPAALPAFDRVGRLLPAAVRGRLQAAVPWMVAGVGTLLVFRGLGLGMPYLSPSTAGACPHGVS